MTAEAAEFQWLLPENRCRKGDLSTPVRRQVHVPRCTANCFYILRCNPFSFSLFAHIFCCCWSDITSMLFSEQWSGEVRWASCLSLNWKLFLIFVTFCLLFESFNNCNVFSYIWSILLNFILFYFFLNIYFYACDFVPLIKSNCGLC